MTGLSILKKKGTKKRKYIFWSFLFSKNHYDKGVLKKDMILTLNQLEKMNETKKLTIKDFERFLKMLETMPMSEVWDVLRDEYKLSLFDIQQVVYVLNMMR